MITVVGGIKGGTGKTTLATNFAVISAHIGKKILLVDADDQGSASDWAEQRDHCWKEKLITPPDYPYLEFPTIKLGGKGLHEQLNRLKDDYDEIFVDAGGRDTISQRSALLIATYYVIPFKPRSYDVWTLGHVKSLIDEVHSLNKTLRAYVCINQGDSQGRDNDEALNILKDDLSWYTLETCIGNRKAFANAAAQGLGVTELEKKEKDAKAIEEIQTAYEEIYR